jgi:NTE family protein
VPSDVPPPSDPAPPRPRVGLVLGGGGATGAAYHAGTLLALHTDTGFDPADADVVVGTSAGSIIGALVRSGVSPDDLAAWGSDVPASTGGRAARAVLDRVGDAPLRLTPPTLDRGSRRSTVLAAALRGRIRPSTGLMAMLPFGLLDPADSLSAIGRIGDAHIDGRALDDWPARDLWVTAVRTRDGARVVFGRDRHADLGDAIAASCAIPGLFRPVRIDGEHHVDGGAASPTNADVLVDAGVDVAIVVSPMSGWTPSVPTRPDHWIRRACSWRLRREAETLRRAGIRVHLLEPGRPVVEALGTNPLSRDRVPRVVTAAFLDASRHWTPSLRADLAARTGALARAGALDDVRA